MKGAPDFPALFKKRSEIKYYRRMVQVDGNYAPFHTLFSPKSFA
jgi:hypothetical protein